MHVPNRWSDKEAEGRSELELLVYRSNLLGQDRAVVNWKGGNTSAKWVEPDFRGRPTRVMYIKGSGTDLKTITADGFVGLRLDDVLALRERDAMSDAEMVDYLRRCMLDPSAPRPSIETLLHAFLPFEHIDHTHPDAILSICNARNGEQLACEIFGDEAVWVPYQRPGFSLSKRVFEAVHERGFDKVKAVLLAKHGLVTWGRTAKECYENTITIINQAAEAIAELAKGKTAFGGVQWPKDTRSAADRRGILARVLPALRGMLSDPQRVVLHHDDSDPVLEFVNSQRAREVALVGAACPDHLVHTKYLPLFVDFDPGHPDVEALKQALQEGVTRYKEAYRQYYNEHIQQIPEGERFPMDPPGPRIVLIPGLGLVAAAKDKATAIETAGLYHRAIEVMKGASLIDEFVSLTPAEAFAVEYWPLERYKLTLAPPERELARRVALITGAAGGIGRAIARRFAEEGAHVVLLDLDEAGVQRLADELNAQFPQRALAVGADVTNERAMQEAFQQAVLHFGGLDLCVLNAGIASAHPIEETTLEEWQRVFGVLATGYFLTAREAFKVLKTQGIGGSLVVVASKNALLASKGAAAYNAAKAAEVQLARTLAEEGGKHGIRVNVVCPDAVLKGSKIWSGAWREERARAYGIPPDQLEEFYRQRTTLKVNVFPEDVAEAVLFFASDRSQKTTGCILTVDGGIPGAYPR